MASSQCHSPIAWPNSEKKKKHVKLINPDVASKESNKLTLNKHLLKLNNCGVLTPSPTTLPNTRRPRRSSIETFFRVYEEFTSSQSSQNFKSIEKNPEETKQLRRSAASFPSLKKQLSMDIESRDIPSNFLEESLNTSLTAESNPGISKPKVAVISRKIFSESSTDEEDSPSMLPLSARIAVGNFRTPLSTKSGNSKKRPVFKFNDSSDKEVSTPFSHQTSVLTFDSSSSEDDLPNVTKALSPKTISIPNYDQFCTQGKPVTSNKNKSIKSLIRPTFKTPQNEVQNVLNTLPVTKKKSVKSKATTDTNVPPISLQRKTPVLVFDSSSSEDEISNIPITPAHMTSAWNSNKTSVMRTPQVHPALTFNRSSSEEELPNLYRNLPVPKKNCHEPKIAASDKTNGHISTTKDKLVISKENVKPSKRYPILIFDDSSFEDDLATAPKSKSTSTPQTNTPVSVPIRNMPSTLPKTGKNVVRVPSAVLQECSLPQSPFNVWISKDVLVQETEFLKSLSDNVPVSQSTAHYRKAFPKHKDELAQKLYRLYNKSVFDNKLPKEMDITWNVRLTATAGFCYNKQHSDAKRSARVELSSKICDSADRVRDTLLHELCHAAAWLVHGVKDGHGPVFQHWGRKAGTLFPFLPVVSRCHTYEIRTKFVYKCLNCAAAIGRHSKSLDINKKVCGSCGGRFQLLVNGKVKETSARGTPDFAKFVKEHYSTVKSTNLVLKHAEIMKKLGSEFAAKARVTGI